MGIIMMLQTLNIEAEIYEVIFAGVRTGLFVFLPLWGIKALYKILKEAK